MTDDIYGPARDVFEAARTRRSIRAFKPDPVPVEIVREIIALGRLAPSGSNIQPWRVHVATGAALARLVAALEHAYLSDEPGHKRDYTYYTDPLEEPYLGRRRECGWGLYGLLGIERGDREKSRAQVGRNYEFFGAPVGLVFSIERKLERGSWLDYGMFLQTIMLAARARGFHTCPQAAIANFPNVCRRELGISDDYMIVCGMAMGYADPGALINTFQPPRIELDAYAVFCDS